MAKAINNGVTLQLTREEAELVRAVFGGLVFNGDRREEAASIYDAVVEAGVPCALSVECTGRVVVAATA